jgi:hypothetical protein
MDLDARQTRSFFLAGTVALPSPYPTLGTISFTAGQMTYSPGERPQDKDLVILYEYQQNRTIVRLMLQEDISAIFVAGERDARGVLQLSARDYSENIEQGEWFVDTDVNAATVRARLNLQQQIDISSRNSVLRGIVFIAEDRPIFHVTEFSQTAGADVESEGFYPCCPCWRICCK